MFPEFSPIGITRAKSSTSPAKTGSNGTRPIGDGRDRGHGVCRVADIHDEAALDGVAGRLTVVDGDRDHGQTAPVATHAWYSEASCA